MAAQKQKVSFADLDEQEFFPGIRGRVHQFDDGPTWMKVTFDANTKWGAPDGKDVHESDEELTIIDGDLKDENGSYGPGDVLFFRGGTHHYPESVGGCTLIVRYPNAN